MLVDPEEARRRAGEQRDRIERRTTTFMHRVDAAYRALAAAEPERIVALDGDAARRPRSRRRSVSTFARFSEHAEAGRLLDAALREGPAHAYLFHGPPGVGKREVARTFARALLGTDREFHADLYELDALGEMIRIDAIRELRRDLHMRPFEADRRVYLIQRAHLLNDDAADALLKDLEEPPPYAVIVLIADDLGPIPETIRSRCQLVPFRRLSERAMRELVDARAPQLADDRARGARARRRRPPRPPRAVLDPLVASAARGADRAGARAVYRRAAFEPAGRGRERRRERPGAAVPRRARSRRRGSRSSTCPRATPSSGSSARRAAPSARSCSRSSRSSPPGTAISSRSPSAPTMRRSTSTSSPSCASDATRERLLGAERAAEAVRELWRELEEFNLAPQLALEALFVRIARELAA